MRIMTKQLHDVTSYIQFSLASFPFVIILCTVHIIHPSHCPGKMLSMRVEPMSEELETELVTAVPCEMMEAPVTEIIEPGITVKVGAVNPLREALDKTCVDDCSDEFEKIGKLLDDRHALLAKVGSEF